MRKMSADAVLRMLNGQPLHYIDDSGSEMYGYDNNDETGDAPVSFGLSHQPKTVSQDLVHAASATTVSTTTEISKSVSTNTLAFETKDDISTPTSDGQNDGRPQHEFASPPVTVFLSDSTTLEPDEVQVNLMGKIAANVSGDGKEKFFQFYDQKADHSGNYAVDMLVNAGKHHRTTADDNVSGISSEDDAASSVAPGTISRRSPSMTPSSLRRAASSRTSTSVASSSASSDTTCCPNTAQTRGGTLKSDVKADAVSGPKKALTNGYASPIITDSRVMLPVENVDGDDDDSSLKKSQLLINRFGFIVGDNAPGTLRCLQYVERPLDVRKVREREKKWLQMLGKWEYFMEKNFTKVRNRCRKGIPPSLRGRAWCHLCGAQFAMLDKPDLFVQLDRSAGDPQWVDLIERDVHRQFPTHELFAKRGGVGQTELLRLLKAYSVHRPQIGYCQAMAPVAATLLTQMPIQDAYYCFDAICSKYIADYYSPGLVEVQTDGEILTELLKRTSPRAYKHMKKQGITYHQYMIEWFMCLFSRTLPWPTLLRVWDIFLCDDTPKTGIKFIFRVALVLLRDSLGHSDVKKQCPSDYDTLQLLKNLPASVVDENRLVRNALEMPISDGDMYRAQQKVRKKRLKDEQAVAAKRAAKSSSSATGSNK